MTAQLSVDNVTVSFDGFRALNDLTLHLEAGELRCIVGPNGAGKTTLMDIITGKTRPDTGTVRFEGKDITRFAEHEIVELGIGRKFQRPTVFPGHTVFENLELTTQGKKGVFRTLFARLSVGRSGKRSRRRCELIGLGGAPRSARRRPRRTGRSSGWRSGCCSCSSRSSCSSTSRWPA